MKEKINDFKKLGLYYSSALKQLETELNIINQEFNTLNETNPINHIKTRIKTISSIVEKLKRRGMDVSIENMFSLNDVVGARIVCNFIDDIYEVVAKIKNNGTISIIEEKDYIKNPKESGYRGYHIILLMPVVINGSKKDIKAEIQIRTTAMDFWGSSEHRLNYKSTDMSNNDKDELKKAAEEVWKIDLTMNELAQKQKRCIKSSDDDMKLMILNNIIDRRVNNEIY